MEDTSVILWILVGALVLGGIVFLIAST